MKDHLGRARHLLQLRRFEAAVDACDARLAEEPDDADAHALRALALVSLNRWDEATDSASVAVRLAPDYALAYFALSHVWSERGSHRPATAAIEEALRIDPANPDFYYQLAYCKTQVNDPIGALTAVDTGLRFNPLHTNCLAMRSALLAHTRREDAENFAYTALTTAPTNAFAHAVKGWVDLHCGRPDAARTAFMQALRLEPHYDYARLGLVEALLAENILYKWLSWLFGVPSFAPPSKIASVAGYTVLVAGFLLAVNYEWTIVGGLLGLLFLGRITFLFSLAWIAVRDAIGRILLCFHPVGRNALTKDELAASAACLACVLAAILLLISAEIYPRGWIRGLSFKCLLLAFTTPFIYQRSPGRRRQFAWAVFGFLTLWMLLGAVASIFRNTPTNYATSALAGLTDDFWGFSFMAFWIASFFLLRAFDRLRRV